MHENQLKEALVEITRIASAVAQNDDSANSNGDSSQSSGCTIKRLPDRLQRQAASVSAQLNPANAPLLELLTVGTPPPDSPLALTLTTAKYWGPSQRVLSVSFMDSPPAELRSRIVSHLNAWATTTSISFAETAGTGDVRISRGTGGYWSYLGTDITLVPKNRQTMNLQGFTMNISEAEFRRVIRHEAGHTLGFPHEHMRRELVARIDPAKAYQYFLTTQGWSKEMVDQQVLTPLSDASIFGTPADQDSIMCYQLPGSITRDGLSIRGGTDINVTDFAFAGLVYPKWSHAEQAPANPVAEDNWDPSEDVLAPL
ncbi:M12 family metallopeptidase [Rhodococcus sp. T2V]|uniref:M12 family metallopeptidase n=1 Tax=Rhodococcus sp. T2V TaxID=3034164 RepID=UPI0023E0DA23|nr:M12 family metallopeptidase [Rhodococcus sp. T2V]MDF3313551.1 M12 family metallopeptidase [Rhodococcus sp. T2V]